MRELFFIAYNVKSDPFPKITYNETLELREDKLLICNAKRRLAEKHGLISEHQLAPQVTANMEIIILTIFKLN